MSKVLCHEQRSNRREGPVGLEKDACRLRLIDLHILSPLQVSMQTVRLHSFDSTAER